MSKRPRRLRRVPSVWDAWERDEQEPEAAPVELRRATPSGGPGTSSGGCSRISPLYELEAQDS